MTLAPLTYWKAGDEERRLRIFISHRYGKDEAMYGQVIADLNSQKFHVQDMSLAASQIMSGPRGSELPKFAILAEIAARIYTSDILIAPSRADASLSEWVMWEVQLAAVGYAIPILFVDEDQDQPRTSLVSEIADLGLPYDVCNSVPCKIVPNVIRLVGGRPNWGVRESEPDNLIRYRGPPASARNAVLTKFPFQPRLTPIDPEPSEPKRGFRLFK
jgi:hypothetical protein